MFLQLQVLHYLMPLICQIAVTFNNLFKGLQNGCLAICNTENGEVKNRENAKFLDNSFHHTSVYLHTVGTYHL